LDYSTSLAKIEEQEDTIGTLQEEKTQLENQIETLEGQIENMVIPEDKTSIFNTLIEATQLYLKELEKAESSRDYLVIADKLATIDETQFTNEDALALITKLREVSYLVAAETHYDTGHGYYSDGKYEKAIKELEKAVNLNPEDVNAIYFMGRSYHRLEDKENAALYYNIVLTEYPDSNRAADAQSFLEEVQE
jgi:TolA-binding protein